jgi:hypothetical protein
VKSLGGWFGWVALVAGCGSTSASPPAAPLAAAPSDAAALLAAERGSAPPDAITTNEPPARQEAPTTSVKLASWFGLSFDLGDDLHDTADYTFKSDTAIEKLSFSRSELTPEQVPAWLSTMRGRIGGAYGARVSDPENLENPRASAMGVRMGFGGGALWTIYVLLETGVIEVDFKCTSDCDKTMRAIVKSVRAWDPTDSSKPPRGTTRYRVASLLTFESPIPLREPNDFFLGPEELHTQFICRRVTEKPAADAWPPIGGDGAEALEDAQTVEEDVKGQVPFRLSYRQAAGKNYAGEPQTFVAAGAIAPLGSAFITCELNPYSKPEALPRLRRFLASARPES